MRSVIAKKAKFISSKSKDKFVYDLPPKLYVIFIVIVGGQHALLSLRGAVHHDLTGLHCSSCVKVAVTPTIKQLAIKLHKPTFQVRLDFIRRSIKATEILMSRLAYMPNRKIQKPSFRPSSTLSGDTNGM